MYTPLKTQFRVYTSTKKMSRVGDVMKIEKLKLIINIISESNVDLNSDRAMIMAIKLNRLEVNKKIF